MTEEYTEVEAVAECAVAVVETPQRELERRREREEYAEREDRKIALSFAMHGRERNGYGRAPNDKRTPAEIVKAAEIYHAFLVAGRKA